MADKTRKPRRPMAERIATLEADIARVRSREEARLIRVARKAGYFRTRISTAGIKALFETAPRQTPRTPRHSQLTKLETEMTRLTHQTTAEARRDDARRKILLGAFLIAQFEHKPKLRAEMTPELDQFLDQHRDPKVAAANKALLADFLA